MATSAAERHRRLAEIITAQDELAAAFMRLDWMVRDLMRAEFCEPPDLARRSAAAGAEDASVPAAITTLSREVEA
ncbi:hypothetical protein [Paracoccus sanguinis]|uniref:Uncharacterized protein n=1 Tax=Paracoccus sanguinis TaxID=1545044 RepID=A0A1H3BQJ1_9RHOB|nr:hypothetical protein [Paracoccus sanguinis]KGJ18698.1 hypothetical protein IX57_02940 [Paracoccus sanguinis]SDX44136.1 hypothetical protein SAMN05444276_106119 [Paracoccus sanguinis]